MRLLWLFVKEVVGLALKSALVFFAAFGVLAVVEVWTTGPIPEPRSHWPLPQSMYASNYDNLEVPVTLLEKVLPPAAQWVGDRERSGRVIRDKENADYIAAYQPILGFLHLAPRFWRRSAGEQAVVLAHEWRHSRQSYRQFVQHSLSKLCFHPREDLVEAEACECGDKVRRALQGRY